MTMCGLLAAAAGTAQAQVRDTEEWLDRCRSGDHGWWGGRESVCEVRETTLPATAALSVDGRHNGGVSVTGWDRNEILVQALVTSAAPSQRRAEEQLREIRIRADGAAVRADGPSTGSRESWSVSYRVYVPRRIDLDLQAHNGGLRVEGVGGRITLDTSNGGVALDGVSGDVRGRTRNGAVTVRLDGRSWQGAGLDVQTTNGSVTLRVPDGYSAQLETGTVNGRFTTDVPLTIQGDLRREVRAQLGSGGPPVRARTTNGAVRIQRS